MIFILLVNDFMVVKWVQRDKRFLKGDVNFK